MSAKTTTETPLAPPEPAKRRGRPRKTEAERDDGNRRQKLISAAAKLFRKKGFSATSTRDIAAAVGMRSGSPFYHFKSKEALLAAVMEEGMSRAIEQQNQLDAAPLATPLAATPQLRLRQLVRCHFQVLLGTGSDFIPVMLYEWRSLNTRQRARVVQLQVEYEAAWQPVLASLSAQGALRGEPKLAKLMLFGALNWAAQWFSPKGTASLDQLTEQVMCMFLHDVHVQQLKVA